MATTRWYNYFETDVTKPPSKTITYKQISFGNYGTYRVFCDPFIVNDAVEWPDGGKVISSVLYSNVYIAGRGINCAGSSLNTYYANDMNLRLVMEISTDNFATIDYSETYDMRTNQGNGNPFYWHTTSWSGYGTVAYTRTETGRERAGEEPYLRDDEKTNRFYESFFIPYALEGKQFKLRYRLGYQHYDGNTSYWSDTVEVNTFNMVAPFGFGIGYRGNRVANGVNEFNCKIDAQYKSRFEYTKPRTLNCFDPVRNESYPYIELGESTDKIYWSFCNPRGTNAVGEISGAEYSLSVFLSMPDPSDKNYMLELGYGNITGILYYQENDDTSMYETTFEHVDTAGHLDKYGYLLRNTNSTVLSSATVAAKYGAIFGVQYKPFRATKTVNLDSGLEPKTVSIEQNIPGSGSSASTYIEAYCWNNGNFYTERSDFTETILDYFIPTFLSISVHRCEADGSANDNGDHCRIDYSISIMPIANQNSKQLTINHPEGTTQITPAAYTQTGKLIVAASTESAYDISFLLKDDLNEVTRTLRLSTAGVIMDWLYGGKGVAFGRVASVENAVHISDDWDLIFGKAIMGGVNLNEWMSEFILRVQAIEQYLSNEGTDKQYEVTIYNDSEMLDRQWVLSGQDANKPSVVPERESTNTLVYSFAGWSLTNGATTDNPDAFKNITAYRSIYAAFTSSTRYYTVSYYNKTELIQTYSIYEYHSNAVCQQTPTSEDGEFVGWRKSGQYVEGDMECYAQFYEDKEIEDSWEEIVAACADRSYTEKYKPGNWKMLDLGTEGSIKMRIKGLKMHRLANNGYAPISWEADTKLTTNKRIGPAANLLFEKEMNDGFKYDGDVAEYFYARSAYKYHSTYNALGSSRKATATFTVTATKGCMVWFAHRYYDSENVSPSGSAGWHETWYKDGAVIVEDTTSITSSLKSVTAQYSMEAGDVATFSVEAYCTGYGGAPSGYCIDLRLYVQPNPIDRDNPYAATVDFSTNKVEGVCGVEMGTGTIGGFAESELSDYLQNTIKPRFPDALRNNLKQARLSTAIARSKRDYPFVEIVADTTMVTDLFIPSSDEIVGANESVANGADFNVLKYQYRKKQNTSSIPSYWFRDVYNASTTNKWGTFSMYYSNFYGYSNTDGNGYKSSGLTTYARPIYICFCT